MTKPMIPFSWWPGAWGLRGQTRAIAQAEYELSGLELQQKLLEIKHGDNPAAYVAMTLELDKQHGIVDGYTYDIRRAEIENTDETAKAIALLDVELAHDHITRHTYERKVADIRKEPWVSMPKIHWDPLHNGKTFFELDYNEYFLENLRKNGYEGTEDEVINLWLNDVCLSIVEEVNDLDADLATPTYRRDPLDE